MDCGRQYFSFNATISVKYLTKKPNCLYFVCSVCFIRSRRIIFDILILVWQKEPSVTFLCVQRETVTCLWEKIAHWVFLMAVRELISQSEAVCAPSFIRTGFVHSIHSFRKRWLMQHFSILNIFFFVEFHKRAKLDHHPQHPFPCSKTKTHTHTHSSLTSKPIHNHSLCLLPARIMTGGVKEPHYWMSGPVVMNGKQPVSRWGTNIHGGEGIRDSFFRSDESWCVTSTYDKRFTCALLGSRYHKQHYLFISKCQKCHFWYLGNMFFSAGCWNEKHEGASQSVKGKRIQKKMKLFQICTPTTVWLTLVLS